MRVAVQTEKKMQLAQCKFEYLMTNTVNT